MEEFGGVVLECTALHLLTKEYFEALYPHSSGGAYVNFMMEEGQDRVRAAFRDN